MTLTWKPGQTCRVGRLWGTVTVLMSGELAIVTLDDLRQVVVPLSELVNPVVDLTGK